MDPKTILRENSAIRGYLRSKRIKNWMQSGYSLPLPSILKQEALLYHAINRQLDVLVETGTYLGEMISAQQPFFRKIYSIELSTELYDLALKKFQRFKNIKLLNGDSSEKLKEVVKQLESPSLFWLDGHYSGGITARGKSNCPIFAELDHVFSSQFRHTVLIDDARLFNGSDEYPDSEQLKEFVRINSDYEIRRENDMFILTPSSAA